MNHHEIPTLEQESETVEEIGKGAAVLALVEVGLGSILHAFHVPTAGHWLSLNQSFWLSRLTFRLNEEADARFSTMTLSNVTASLKSLSPAGKRLTPMLAISAQGAFFNLGTLLLGRNIIGASLGSVLSSTWAFIQPVAIYYAIFGNTLIEAGAKFFKKVQEVFHFSEEQAITAALIIVGAKALLSIGVVLLARMGSQEKIEMYRQRLLDTARRSYRQSPRVGENTAKAALRDLFHPLFFISFVLTIVFFFWVESSRAALIWGLVRPVAVGFIFFFSFRILPTERLLSRLEKHGPHRFARAFRIAQSLILHERRKSIQRSKPDGG